MSHSKCRQEGTYRYKAQDVLFVVIYIFSGVYQVRMIFSLLSSSAPSLFLWLGRYIGSNGGMALPNVGEANTKTAWTCFLLLVD